MIIFCSFLSFVFVSYLNSISSHTISTSVLLHIVLYTCLFPELEQLCFYLVYCEINITSSSFCFFLYLIKINPSLFLQQSYLHNFLILIKFEKEFYSQKV